MDESANRINTRNDAMERFEDASPPVMWGTQVPFAKMVEPYGRASTWRVKISVKFGLW